MATGSIHRTRPKILRLLDTHLATVATTAGTDALMAVAAYIQRRLEK